MTVEEREKSFRFSTKKEIFGTVGKKMKKNKQQINPLHYLPYGGPELRVFGLAFYIF